MMTLVTTGLLRETKDGNRYALIAIDHYSKWCERKHVKDHDNAIVARFLEEEIICRFGVPKFILTDNGGEWMAEFDLMCKKYGIIHQFIAPQCPQCNGMVEKMIKTLKNGLFVMSSIDLDNWDLQLLRILFGYRCGVQASTNFSLFMVLIGRTPRFTCDNGLSTFTNVEKDELTLDEMTQLMVEKLKLIYEMHSFVLENVDLTQKKQRKSYATWKGKQEFLGLEEGRTRVKMRKPRKKKHYL
jgi:transposase InsO family protein